MRGATLGADHGNDGGCDFNPRTPCGVRRGKNSTSTRRGLFQSTHPMRGATIIFVQCVPQLSFQSTHPMRGATPIVKTNGTQIVISIHAPHAGCDTSSMSPFSASETFQSTHPMRGATSTIPTRRYRAGFQSTHPMRGATFSCLKSACRPDISIHAPHAGCDPIAYNARSIAVLFQSTHPMRGATPLLYRKTVDATDFNPRTPCGVRP